MAKRKCKECGFLAIRHRVDRTLDSPEFGVRQNADFPSDVNRNRVMHEVVPLCFRLAADLEAEKTEYDPQDRDEKKTFLAVINADRECDEFTPWVQGFTPKEHLEMIQQAKMLEWQKEREAADRAFRREESERSERSLQQANKHHLVNLVVFGVLITFVTVAVQVLVALIQAGVLAK